MGLFKLVLALFILSIGANAALSQCCCSGPYVNITDGGGFTLKLSDVQVKELFPTPERNRISLREAANNDASFYFRVGCGSGKEALLIEHLGVQMRIRFMLLGDFGHPQMDISFVPGDYIAEFAKEREDDRAQKIVIRSATAEEMKEIEPPAKSDEPSDQTANPF